MTEIGIHAKTFYEWGRRCLRRIELFGSDVEKKPELPIGNPLGRLHQKILDAGRKRKK